MKGEMKMDMKTVATVSVNNVPEYALDKQFWVVRADEENRFWFYGAWTDEKTAEHIAKQVDGFVVMNVKFI